MAPRDMTKYRCTLICRCSADYAEGYGATPAEAEASARVHWRRGGHKRADIADTIRERAVEHSGGSHYEKDMAEADAACVEGQG